jgi:PAS domain S-box-containing protein
MFVKVKLRHGDKGVYGSMTNYPYVDIAVLDTVRRSFAAGDALVIVSYDLRSVIWANGNGLELFGLGRLDAALNGEAALDDIQRRQISGVVPQTNDERVVHLRFVQGPQTVLLPVHVSVIALPDAVDAVLLRIPARSLKSRAQTGDTLEAIRNAGSHAAFIKLGARLISGAEDLAALEIDPEDLARMMREVAGENDRLVKRQLRTARGDLPAALARLTDEDGLHLLVVIEPDANEAMSAASAFDSGFEDELAPSQQETEVVSDGSAFDDGSFDDSLTNDQTSVEAPSNPAPTISSFWVDEPDEAETLAAEPEAHAPKAPELPANTAISAPVRFAWKTSANGKFVEISDAFLATVKMAQDAIIGHTLRSLKDSIQLIDPTNVADLFDRQGTWSGRSVLWPVSGTQTAIPVELAGLPVFSRDRVFEGFRGFGVARPELAQTIENVQTTAAEIPSEGNVVPFGRRTAPPIANLSVPALDDNEREAFAEIGARLRDEPLVPTTSDIVPLRIEGDAVAEDVVETTSINISPLSDNASVFSKLPLPVLVYSNEALHFANSAFLELSGYPSLAAIKDAGGLDALFGDGSENAETDDDTGTGMHLMRADGTDVSVNAHLQSVPWGDGKALMLAVAPRGATPEIDLAATQLGQSDTAPEMAAAQQQIEELTAILDTATDGVVVLDAKGNIRSLNNAAQALFGYDDAEIAGQPLNALLAIESHRAANDYMAGLVENGVASVLNDGRDMIGREREGRFLPIFVNIARLSSSDGFCAVIKDVTNWKRAEEQLTSARRDAESASSNKTEFLSRMSHEIRTPLNAIIGFSDVMMNERFGPLGNERYKDYLQDIHRSGNLVLSLVNDLLDISKIEAGGQSFDFRAIELNAIVEEAVGMMQPQASRERVLIRTSYGYDLPQLVADERSIKQIVLNLVSNAIRFTDAGGQVIVSTSYEQNGDLTLKVRDTGIGMNENELEDALRPYRQVGQKPVAEAGGTGLGLPLARALAESNKGDFRIRSTPGEGTVIEIAFPASRVLAG